MEEIIKIWEEMNKIETNKNINEMKIQFIIKINKINKSLAKLTK